MLSNLRKHDTAYHSPLLSPQANEYLLRVLRLMLAIAAVAVATVWYQETTLNLINMVDRIAYPLLLTVTSLGSLLLILRPTTMHVVMNTVFITLISYLLIDYYYILAFRLPTGIGNGYTLASLGLWLPLGYVASYVFYSPRVAMRSSLGIYAAIAVPQWWLLGAETSIVDRQIVISMLISHPVYIAALWGVAQLKSHASGAQDLAESMSVAATVDPLTGMANRRAMLHALESVTRVLTAHDRPIALLLLDVDRFKGINDRFGHAVGDKVLLTLTQHTNALLRSTDLLGRWGGEEFMIIALDLTGAQAVQMAERLRAELEGKSHTDAGTVTVSIGVTSYIHGEAVDVFINRADDALYRAKDLGRNRVEALFLDVP